MSTCSSLSPKEDPDEEYQYCRGERAVGGKRSNDFTCSLLVPGQPSRCGTEVASVREAKEWKYAT